MSVRVYFDERDSLTAVDYPDAKRYEATDREVLTVFGPAGRVLATFASGRWYRAEVLPSPDPEPPLLRSGTVVRIPGIDVPYVVDKGLATSGPHATLTFTTVDGRDWSDDRSEPVNTVAEPDPRVTDPGDSRYGGSRVGGGPIRPLAYTYNGPDEREVFVPSAPAEAVLSETTEPFVSVNLSVTSDNSAEVLKVIKEALRNGSLTIPAKALA